MKKKTREYSSGQITVQYDVGRCIHAAECVRGLPAVFDPKRRPWIDPGQTDDLSKLAEVIERCPTGALQYRSEEGAPAESPDETNVVRVRRRGPLYMRGSFRLLHPDGETSDETRLALCRCGLSENKPFCDNSHVGAEFAHDGSLAEVSLKTEDDAPPTAEVQPRPDGPVLVSGAMEVAGADGSVVHCTAAAFCRCGHSSTKPFCDGTHRKVGFKTGP